MKYHKTNKNFRHTPTKSTWLVCFTGVHCFYCILVRWSKRVLHGLCCLPTALRLLVSSVVYPSHRDKTADTRGPELGGVVNLYDKAVSTWLVKWICIWAYCASRVINQAAHREGGVCKTKARTQKLARLIQITPIFPDNPFIVNCKSRNRVNSIHKCKSWGFFHL